MRVKGQRRRSLVKRYAIGVLVLCVMLTSCSSSTPAAEKKPPQLVPTSQLNKLLLSTDEVNAVMGTSSLTPHPVDTAMADNRNLLPNLNCLGIWQVGESAIYGPSDGDKAWQGLRRQTLRTPDVDNWDTLAVQSVVYYPTAEAAGDFFAQSADRWSKCTNHHVNITLNDQPLPKWLSGDLGKTDTQLAMPITRGQGTEVRACQHVLQRSANLIIDVEACKPQTAPVTAAAELVAKIEAKLPD
jgi:PknH-like extracellular domain